MHTCTRSQTGFTDFARIQNFLRSFNFSRGGGVVQTPLDPHMLTIHLISILLHIRGKSVSCTITWLPLLFDVFETFEFSNWRSGHYFVDHGWWVSYAISFRFVLIYIELRSLFNPLPFLQNTMKKDYLCKLIANTSESIKVTTFASFWISLKIIRARFLKKESTTPFPLSMLNELNWTYWLIKYV